MLREEHKLCVVCSDASRTRQANQFCEAHDFPLYKQRQSEYDLQLCYSTERIELFDSQLNTGIYVDFIDGTLAHRKQFGGGRGQAIAKAIGLKQGKTPIVLDVTAGLARDAYILATLGCKVTLIEQSPVLHALVKDGIERAFASDTEHSARNFIELICKNSVDHIKHTELEVPPDIIYIDPMYPERKKSALVKKDMQILHKLIGSSENEEKLLDAALNHAKHRVVVKRPIHAQPVSGIKPTMAISSKKTRYDVYVIK